MLTSLTQRWRHRRATYRPAGETIATQNYEVSVTRSDKVARQFVETHHYSGSYPAARLRVCLTRGDELVGVAVFSQPPSQAALDAALPFEGERVELGRFVLLDDVPANGESWFLARAFRLARAEGFEAVVAHSDPEPRRGRAGTVVFPGHIGTIYQATNARYVGRTPTRTWRVLPDGTVLSARALTKLRLRDRGWRYVVDELVRHGAEPPSGDWHAWVKRAVEGTSSTLRHHGNHRYLWALDPRVQRHLPSGVAYPKLEVSQ